MAYYIVRANSPDARRLANAALTGDARADARASLTLCYRYRFEDRSPLCRETLLLSLSHRDARSHDCVSLSEKTRSKRSYTVGFTLRRSPLLFDK
ncbi:MAG: hypothetical protein PUP91_09895 [Rhizonema sp. PD37]|nr:hypothetical protein [Rhizonema sp. PD37]